MRYQKDSFSCGAAAVVNAVRCFGRRIAEKNVRVFSNTTPEDGTSEEGIISALRGLGHGAESFEFMTRVAAADQLRENLMQGRPSIICIQNLQHWVTVVGMIGNKFVIFDPANTKGNKLENGMHILSLRNLKRLWQARNGRYFGITCKK